jgi:hypothetical protein
LPIWPTPCELQIIVKSAVNCFSWQIMGLSKFHDTLSTIILHFGGDIGDGHHPGKIYLIHCQRRLFSYYAF